MKPSSSTLLKTMKNSYFNSLIGGESIPQGTYSKTKEKISMLEFELDRNRDIIKRLRAELASKNKEITLLKVNKNKKNEEYQKTMRVIEEILRQCDQSTTAGFNAIENSISMTEINNKNNNNNKLPQIGDMLHFSKQHKKTMKEMVYISMLKDQINSLNEEMVKKDEEIIELKKNRNSTNYTKLQNNFIKNFNELTQVKKENEYMKTRIEDVAHLLMVEKEDNFHLKNRLQDFQGQFKDYKNITVKKTNELESLLLKAKKRERDCKIFHIRKGNSMSAIPPQLRNKDENYKNEKYDEFDEDKSKLNEDLKKMSKTMTLLKNDKTNKENEIRILKNEKKELNLKIHNLENEKNQLLQQYNSLNKQLQDVNNKKKIAEKDIKKQAIDANEIIKKLEKENEDLNNKNQNLQNKIDEKDCQIDEEKSRTKAMKDLLEEQENENKKLKIQIEELKKQIEALQKEKNVKDDMFFTSVGITKTPHNEEKEKIKYNLNDKENNENKKSIKEENENEKKDNYIDNENNNNNNQNKNIEEKNISYITDNDENNNNNNNKNDIKKKKKMMKIFLNIIFQKKKI